MKLIAIGVAGLCALTSLGASEVTEDDTSSPWHYQLYVDAGYAYTTTIPRITIGEASPRPTS